VRQRHQLTRLDSLRSVGEHAAAMRGACALVLVAAAAVGAPAAEPAAGEPDPPVGWSLAAGVATALVPLAVGGGMLSAEGATTAMKEAGATVAVAGLALAPFVSHAVAREWRRAIYFSVLPVGAAAGTIALAFAKSELLTNSDRSWQVGFAVMFGAALFSSAGGLVDSAWAGERARARRAVSLAPLVGGGRLGLALGGTL
jgi:hypothetical protein